MLNRRKLKTISAAVTLGLLAQANIAIAADEDEIEEVVAVGTRLQGSAAAVIEERRGQAFVADILGAEQLSRTGDSRNRRAFRASYRSADRLAYERPAGVPREKWRLEQWFHDGASNCCRIGLRKQVARSSSQR